MKSIAKEIISGRLPSEVFKEILLSDSASTNSDLAAIFKEEFPNAGSESMQMRIPANVTADSAERDRYAHRVHAGVFFLL